MDLFNCDNFVAAPIQPDMLGGIKGQLLINLQKLAPLSYMILFVQLRILNSFNNFDFQ